MSRREQSLRRRVVIESPFAGDLRSNEQYLQAAMKHSLSLGEAPFASHRLYTWVLEDQLESERITGMMAGFSWMQSAELVAVYQDLGISPGMVRGMEMADKFGLPIEFRLLPTATMRALQYSVEPSE